MSKFYQCDVAESGSDNNIWTGPVLFCEHEEEAEFATMLALQSDWGDSYIPDSFLEAFGEEGSGEPEFPGVEAWKRGDYWRDWELMTSISIGMLVVPPIEALAQLGKIAFDMPDDVVAAVMRDEAKLHVVVDMREAIDA